jgi:MoaA/NifB/PqqE/SkfB family radical SAM enzyme
MKIKNIFSLFSFFISRKIKRKKPPLLASFKLTYLCNLTCKACPFHFKSKEKDKSISWKKATGVIDQLQKEGCKIVVFEGGEPFLWKDGEKKINDLVNYCRGKFICVAVTTNGTYSLNINSDIIWVSIDGKRETHNILRNNSFDQLVKNINETKHKKILVHYTINRENWNEIEENIISLSKIISFKGITYQFFYPYNQGEEDLLLSKQKRKEAVFKIIKLKEKGYNILNSKKTLLKMIDNKWKCHEDLLTNIDPDGTITNGCYVTKRGRKNCENCGFTPVAEASGALDFKIGSMIAGWKIFMK